MLEEIPIEIIIKIGKYLDVPTFTNFIKNDEYLFKNKFILKALEEKKKLNAAKVICHFWNRYKINHPTFREFLRDF